MPLLLLFLLFGNLLASPIQDGGDKDGDTSRKILGSSVVTSVSVIMDAGNGSQTYFADAVGKPVSKPSTSAQLASPINLLNPDRYEFFTFDDDGELIKRLMTLEEIQGIIANGDGEDGGYGQETYQPEKKVNDIVSNVQNVLKEEIKSHRNTSLVKPMLDTPDVSSTWSMILPAIFGNSGEDIIPDKTQAAIITPETIVVDNSAESTSELYVEKHAEVIKPVYIDVPQVTTERPVITLSIITNKTDQQIASSKPAINETASANNVERLPVNKNKPQNNQQITSKRPAAPIVTEATNIIERGTVVEKDPEQSIITASTDEAIKHDDNSATNTNGSTSSVTTVASTTKESTQQSTTLSTTVKYVSPTVASVVQNSTKLPPISQPTSSTTQKIPVTTAETTSAPPELPKIVPSVEPTTSSTPEPIQLIGSREPNRTTSSDDDARIETTPIPIGLNVNEDVNENQTEETKIISLEFLPFDGETTTTIIESTTTSSTEESSVQSVSESEVAVGEVQETATSSSSSNGYAKATTPQADVPETSTNGFLSTFFFVDDDKRQSSTTSERSVGPTKASSTNEEIIQTPTPSPVNQITTLPEILKTNSSDNDEVDQEASSNDEITTLRESVEQITQNPTIIINNINTGRPTTVSTNWATTFYVQESINEKPSILLNQTVTSAEKQEGAAENSTSDDGTNKDSTKLSNLNDTVESEETMVTDEITTLKEIAKQTTQNPIATGKQPVTETLNQLLLSSTNIYEINSQLADLTSATGTTNLVTDDDTTEQSLISSIEQLMSQAIGIVEEPSANNPGDHKKVEGTLGGLGSKPMSDVQAEAATVASILLDKDNGTDENSQLGEAVDSILSQVFNPQQGIVTTEEDTLKPTHSSSEATTEELVSTNVAQQTTEFVPEKINDETATDKYYVEQSSIAPETTSSKIIAQLDKTEVPEKEYVKVVTQETDSTSDKSKNANESVTNAEVEKLLERNITSTIQEHFIQISIPEKVEIVNNEKDQPNIVADGDKMAVTDGASKLESSTQRVSVSPANSEQVKNVTTVINQSNQQLVNDKEVDKVTNVYDVISSTPKYTTSPQLISSATNIAETVTKERVNASAPGSNYKMESATEAFSATTTNSKVDVLIKPLQESKNSTWTLVPTVLPHSNVTFSGVISKPAMDSIQAPGPVKLSPQPVQGFGLEDSTSRLDTDIYQFVELCNELAFGFWGAVTTGISSARSVFVSPFAATSLLAMVFLGARGATSGEMNEILKLDDMVTFNPHMIFKNVSDTIEVSRSSGVAASVIARELYSDRSKGKLLSFYKERARQFYDGHVEEVSFREIGDIIRRRTNLLVKKYTFGKIQEYMKDGSITVRPPLAGVSASVFQTDCSSASTQGRDGELYFVVLPSVRQRRLIPIPASVFRSGFLAGYEPTLDATAAAIGTQDQAVSVIFVIPGQQGVAAPGDGLTRLEKRLVESSFKQGSWSRLLRSLIPRPGLELQIPRFSHKSVINATVALKNMGLKDLFSYDKADLKGLNGAAHELHLSDILQINNFVMCGEVPIGESHHVEIYPATAKRPSRRSRKLEHRLYHDLELGDEPRDYQRAFHDPLHDPNLLSLPLPLRPRQARIPDAPRLRFDRPFLFFVRHNPTGLVLHMGRFNPRLLP